LRPLCLYRQRARAIVKAAQFILKELGGEVPRRYEDLRRIPGVGDYIAAAVAIAACGEEAPALDVNVARVLSRIALGRDAGKRYMYDRVLRQLAGQIRWTRELLFAVIDFAAQICTARSPKCHKCPAKGSCMHFQLRGQAQGRAYS
jgi:A/G-specific adenine glycosylase